MTYPFDDDADDLSEFLGSSSKEAVRRRMLGIQPRSTRRMVLVAEFERSLVDGDLRVATFYPDRLFRPEALQAHDVTRESWLMEAWNGNQQYFPTNPGDRLSLMGFAMPVTPLPFHLGAAGIGNTIRIMTVGPWSSLWLSGTGIVP